MFSHSRHWVAAAVLAVLAAVVGSAAPPATAHDIKHKTLQIVHPWAHESKVTDNPSADVYMTIRNTGRAADRLISASSTRSQQFQLIPIVPHAFQLPPGQEIKFSKDTGFVRLLGLTKPLYMHDNFKLTLVFEKAGKIEVEVHIEEAKVVEPHKH